MKSLFYTSIIMALLATACGSLHVPNSPADLPLRYHNAQHGLTLFLPASWQGYSVLIQQWDGEDYSPATDKVIIAPIVILLPSE